MTTSPAPPAAPTPAPTWTTEIRRDEQALLELVDPLRDLYRRSPAATPFQSPAWLAAWWSNYGRSGCLRLALVWRDQTLMAAAPLLVVRRATMPVLVPLAHSISDFSDLLVDADHADEALAWLITALLAEPHWSAIDLTQLRPGSTAHDLARHWPGRVWRTQAAPCLELPGGPLGELLATYPGRTAGKLRSKLRKIDNQRIAVSEVAAHEAPQAVHELLRLHTLQWHGRKINPEHMRDRFRRHLAQACTEMIRHDEAVVFQYRDAGGRLIATDLVLIGHRLAGAYLYGCRPTLRNSIDVTLMLLRQDLACTDSRGLPVFSMLRGQEPYKAKWRPTTVVNQRLILGRGHQARLYAAAVVVRTFLIELKHRYESTARNRRAGSPAPPQQRQATGPRAGKR
ncbi:GNAT family N-acetyltransferase [Spirillospora sp. NPDC048911]|uniref:GNAT family N-acetyltransferase n=1 Tax=Spirillospora sp. NPDC048911 TaxID=3364527 RepID=UPI00370F8BCB